MPTVDRVNGTLADSATRAAWASPRLAMMPAMPTGARATGIEQGLPVTVGDNCWIGGGAILCPGVTVGDRTVIGAGSVVTRDLPADCVAAGNPARVIRRLR